MKRIILGFVGLMAIGSLAIVGIGIYLYSSIFRAHAPLEEGQRVGPATTIVVPFMVPRADSPKTWTSTPPS